MTAALVQRVAPVRVPATAQESDDESRGGPIYDDFEDGPDLTPEDESDGGGPIYEGVGRG